MLLVTLDSACFYACAQNPDYRHLHVCQMKALVVYDGGFIKSMALNFLFLDIDKYNTLSFAV